MIYYKKGDTVLVPFPFSDQTAVKKRPAVVISSERYNRQYLDIVIMAITGRGGLEYEKYLIKDWKEAGLLIPSAVKPVISTIMQSLVIKRMGVFSNNDLFVVQNVLREIFDNG